MAREGLRTLVVAKKQLSEEQYADFEVCCLAKRLCLYASQNRYICYFYQQCDFHSHNIDLQHSQSGGAVFHLENGVEIETCYTCV